MALPLDAKAFRLDLAAFEPVLFRHFLLPLFQHIPELFIHVIAEAERGKLVRFCWRHVSVTTKCSPSCFGAPHSKCAVTVERTLLRDSKFGIQTLTFAILAMAT